MIASSFILLHGGQGLEMTLLTYLYRVLLYLLVFGGIGVLVFWWLDVVEVVRSAFLVKRGHRENDR